MHRKVGGLMAKNLAKERYALIKQTRAEPNESALGVSPGNAASHPSRVLNVYPIEVRIELPAREQVAHRSREGERRVSVRYKRSGAHVRKT